MIEEPLKMTLMENIIKQLEFIIAHGDEVSANAARAALREIRKAEYE